jgi:hypothetical protein
VLHLRWLNQRHSLRIIIISLLCSPSCHPECIPSKILHFRSISWKRWCITCKLEAWKCATLNLSLALHGCEAWSLLLREEQRQRLFKNRLLRGWWTISFRRTLLLVDWLAKQCASLADHRFLARKAGGGRCWPGLQTCAGPTLSGWDSSKQKVNVNLSAVLGIWLSYSFLMNSFPNFGYDHSCHNGTFREAAPPLWYFKGEGS